MFRHPETLIVVAGLMIFFWLAVLALPEEEFENVKKVHPVIRAWTRWQWLYWLACYAAALFLRLDPWSAGAVSTAGALVIMLLMVRATHSRWTWTMVFAAISTGVMVGLPVGH